MKPILLRTALALSLLINLGVIGAVAYRAAAPSAPPPGETLPRHLQRPLLERRAPQLQEAAWVVDPGRAPWGDGALLGQISWLAAADVADGSAPERAPDPALMEHRLRQGLAACGAAWISALEAAGPYHQVPVAFSSNGLPLVGPVPRDPAAPLTPQLTVPGPVAAGAPGRSGGGAAPANPPATAPTPAPGQRPR